MMETKSVSEVVAVVTKTMEKIRQNDIEIQRRLRDVMKNDIAENGQIKNKEWIQVKEVESFVEKTVAELDALAKVLFE